MADHQKSGSRRRGSRKLGCRHLLLAFAAVVLGSVALCLDWPCFTAFVDDGIWVKTCPSGTPLPAARLRAWDLARGSTGRVQVEATAVYSLGGADDRHRTALRRFDPTLSLVDAEGEAIPIEPEDGWESRDAGRSTAEIELPEVPDGDYVLRAHLDTPVGETTVEADLPLYAPALVHLATDRPLYEPGHAVKMRAVILAQKDLTPLGDRPGTFTVISPQGDTLLEERVPAGSWGVAATSFPLADSAPHGTYLLRYTSGAAADEVSVQVEPFELPRLQVQATPTRPWFAPGERPVLEGRVRYRSGAPVGDARVEVRFTTAAIESGTPSPIPQPEWPPPNDWTRTRNLTTGPEGDFSVTLSEIPDDLNRPVALAASIFATDPAGERVHGGARLVVSPDPVLAALETELAEGLVPDFNNRVYVRVTTPAGQPLPGADVTVRRAWDPSDAGATARTDANAVAALQVDPGRPVSITVPPAPYRPPPPDTSRRVHRTELRELLSASDVSLSERTILDGWAPDLEPCAALLESGTSAWRFGVAVSPAGQVERVAAPANPTARCIADRVLEQRGPTGASRFYLVSWQVSARPGSRLEMETEAAPKTPSSLQTLLDLARQRARPCIIDHAGADPFPERLHWRIPAGERRVSTTWHPVPRTGGAWTDPERTCVRQAFSDLSLHEPLVHAHEGVTRLSVAPDPTLGEPAQASPQVYHGYELTVAVAMEGESIGQTTVRTYPGAVPDVRLRALQPVLSPGDEIRIQLLRGPDFHGLLPREDREYPLRRGSRILTKLQFDREERIFYGKFPATPAESETPGEPLHGLLTFEWSHARTVLLVPRSDALEVDITPDRQRYRPGDTATLTVSTRAGGTPAPASVSLFGVDEALSQLAPLLSPDDWGRITVRARTEGAAFGEFDARALLTGRIQGENAALATLLRVSDVGRTTTERESVSPSAFADATPEQILVENFYAVLTEVRRRVATWERAAPESEVMTPEHMFALWEQVLDQRETAGQPCSDAYGEPLHLWRLPSDLLELTEPRMLVTDARRLPEDVENWSLFVAEEAP